MSQKDFFSMFCGAPVVVPPKPITENDVNEYIKAQISDKCKDLQSGQSTVIKLEFPEEFRGLLTPTNFWYHCRQFLDKVMKFKHKGPSHLVTLYYRDEMIFDHAYNSMPFQHYYTIEQREQSHYNEFYTQDYIKNDDCYNMIVFRIYKS